MLTYCKYDYLYEIKDFNDYSDSSGISLFVFIDSWFVFMNNSWFLFVFIDSWWCLWCFLINLRLDELIISSNYYISPNVNLIS